MSQIATMATLPTFGDQQTLVAWRLDKVQYASTWDSGIGAETFGGRWNAKGQKAVYCALDPSTVVLEMAVHIGFHTLDTQPHVLTCLTFAGDLSPHIVLPESVPNPGWLQPGTPSAGQQAFGARLLAEHGMFLVPSAVSSHSWNLVFSPSVAAGRYEVVGQERFVLDTRLHPPA